MLLRLDEIPVFYLPYLRGDANDPLGPLESVGISYKALRTAKALLGVESVFQPAGFGKGGLWIWRLGA